MEFGNFRCARQSLGKEEVVSRNEMTKTFHCDPSGASPEPARLTRHRNRVLRGARVTWAAKRTQGVCRPCDRASKAAMWGRRPRMSGRLQGADRVGRVRAPHRGQRAGHVHERVAQEPGRAHALLARSAMRASPNKRPGIDHPRGAGRVGAKTARSKVPPSEGNEVRRDGG